LLIEKMANRMRRGANADAVERSVVPLLDSVLGLRRIERTALSAVVTRFQFAN
jgi:hypothetical protein